MRSLSLAIAGALCVLLGACGGGDPSANTSAELGNQQASPLPSAQIAPQTPSASELARAGQEMSGGLRVAMNEVLANAAPPATSVFQTSAPQAHALAALATQSQLYWYNPVTGDNVVWGMNGATATSNIELLRVPGWQVTHVADFAGDGQRYQVWQNYGTGQTVIWLLNGNVIVKNVLLLTAPGWRVIKTADFNGDGKADLLWYNAQTGQTVIWLMDGANLLASQLLLTLITTAIAYEITGR